MLQLLIGLRLESLRLPLKTALETARRLGAQAVEINARTELRPDEMSRTAIRQVKKLLADLNLAVAALHFPTRRGYDELDDLERRLDATRAAMRLAYDLGAPLVVNQVGKVPETKTDPAWDVLVSALSDLGQFGLRVGARLAARTGREAGTTLRALFESVPAVSLAVDFDPAELIINGRSAVEAMRALAPWVAHFRARDGVVDTGLGRGLEVPLGRGSADWPALLGMLEEQNYRGFVTVDCHADDDPVGQCGLAIQYLKNLF